MNCRTCSAPIADGTRFCQVCGTPVSTLEDSSAPAIITIAPPAPDAEALMQTATTTAHTPIPEASASSPTIITDPSHDAANLPAIDDAATLQPLPYPPYPSYTPSPDAPSIETSDQAAAS